jgi:hypothetical protein
VRVTKDKEVKKIPRAEEGLFHGLWGNHLRNLGFIQMQWAVAMACQTSKKGISDAMRRERRRNGHEYFYK